MITSHSRFELIRATAMEGEEGLASAVAEGLSAERKSLPCRFLYDAEGSRLFEAICKLPEYYSTRAERQILLAESSAIAATAPSELDVVELGSGSAEKTDVLLEALLARGGNVRYMPIDICREVLEESCERMLAKHAGLNILAVQAEYLEGLSLAGREARDTRWVLGLGSNVGNFDRDHASSFLASVRSTLEPSDRLFLGIDLRKSKSVLEAAYDDAQGVTAAFNKNLLVRINRELGADFDPEAFTHLAPYDEDAGRIDMFLESDRAQSVRIAGETYHFARGERIHTESSFKYAREEIAALAATAGFTLEDHWRDGEQRFSLNLLTPRA